MLVLHRRQLEQQVLAALAGVKSGGFPVEGARVSLDPLGHLQGFVGTKEYPHVFAPSLWLLALPQTITTFRRTQSRDAAALAFLNL
ncbi:MAG: hypothetical protein KJ726_11975 [Verrucomicrobia bacterium]|nr:hypothetical protein [Verrucomicrobiota bacterium]